MEVRPIRFLRNMGRLWHIITVLVNNGFADVVERLRLMRYFHWWRRVVLRRRVPPPKPPATMPQRIRMVIEDLGATFIKFGQVASTRPDLIPAEIIAELSRLQEAVPPFPSEEATRIFADAVGTTVEEAFAEFNTPPLAAGSLGQVHRAKHHDGTSLAVKIRRPKVVYEVERDISLLSELAALLERRVPEAEVFDPVGLVNQFARAIRRELNFVREGRTLDEFRRLFRNDATLYVPKVYWEVTSEAVLTMEFIEGLRVTDLAGLEAAGISAADVAANGARIFMKQAFGLGVFHGDPHPGNIRVMPDGAICLLDYGMIGHVDEEKREQLVDLLVAERAF